MNPNQVLSSGERGLHLLFDTEIIAAAYAQDALLLRGVVDSRGEEFQHALAELLGQPNAERGRCFIRSLPQEFQYLIVLLYFDLLDTRVRSHSTLH